MSEQQNIIKRGLSEKESLNAERQKLEKELMELGSGVSESQIWHKKARINEIKKEIKALDEKQFKSGNDKLKSMMESQNAQGLTPEMMAASSWGVDR